MIHQSIQPYLPKVIELFRKHKITSAYVFGSVLTEKFNDQKSHIVRMSKNQGDKGANGVFVFIYGN